MTRNPTATEVLLATVYTVAFVVLVLGTAGWIEGMH